MQVLYSNIKQLRLQNNMTQGELAEKMGYSDRSIIAKIEHGEIDLPMSRVERFAEIFDVTPEVLCGWVSESDTKAETAQEQTDTSSYQTRADQVMQRIISSFQQAVDMSDGSIATGEVQANMLADISLTLAMILDKMERG